MDIGNVIFFENEQNENHRIIRAERRVLRDKYNPFELDDFMFKKNFRLNKAAVRFVLNLVERELDAPGKSCALNPIHRLAGMLRFFAEGGYQHGVGKDSDIGMSQSTVSVVLKNGLEILEKKLCPTWIQLQMSDQEKHSAKTYFYNKFRFPGVILTVDGTHIRIIRPTKEKFIYYNRKGYYSLNVMLICDHKMTIRYVDARYPGCNHDSHIWSLSDARHYFKTKYQEGERNSFVLGDSGYPLEPWLMTPFRSPAEPSPEYTYNLHHKNARTSIERIIGVVKNRFRCILGARQLHYSPKKAVQIVNVVCALHNICLHFHDSNEQEDILTGEFVSQENDEIHVEIENEQVFDREAIRIREDIANALH